MGVLRVRYDRSEKIEMMVCRLEGCQNWWISRNRGINMRSLRGRIVDSKWRGGTRSRVAG